MTIKEIDEQIAVLRAERKRLKEEEIAKCIKESEHYVGMCFSCGGEYAKVIGVPTQLWDNFFHCYVNASELPSLVIDMYDDVPFSFYTINPKNTTWKEISEEEFNAVFEKAVVQIREKAGINA